MGEILYSMKFITKEARNCHVLYILHKDINQEMYDINILSGYEIFIIVWEIALIIVWENKFNLKFTILYIEGVL